MRERDELARVIRDWLGPSMSEMIVKGLASAIIKAGYTKARPREEDRALSCVGTAGNDTWRNVLLGEDKP